MSTVIDTDINKGDPYTQIINIINRWCEQNYYTNFLVTIALDTELTVEFLEFNASDFSWIWQNDWWEGQSRIELIGFVAQENILVEGTPDSYIFLKDKTEEAT